VPSLKTEARPFGAAGAAAWAFCLGMALAGCAGSGLTQSTYIFDVPQTPSSRAEAECKVMYDQAMVAARGYSAAVQAKQLYWDCLQAKAAQ
jgi:hypothetical protein